MIFNRIIVLGLVLGIIFAGCRKKKAADEVNLQDSELETSSLSGGDSADIFDEFYDDAGKAASSKSGDFSSASSKENFDPDGPYVVQVSCVLSKNLAEDVASQLERKGYPAYVADVENPTPDLLGIYYRIRIGGFNAISDATEFGESYLVNDGYEYWVDNRSNDHVGVGGYGLGGSSSSSSYENAYTSEPATYTPAEETVPSSTPPADTWETSEPYSTPTEEVTTEPAGTETIEPATAAPEPEAKASEPVSSETEAVTTPSPEKASTDDDWGTSGDEWGTTDDEWVSDTSSW